jgi:hypothetical protein
MCQTNLIVAHTKSTFKLGLKTKETPKREIPLVKSKILNPRGLFPLGFESKTRNNGVTTMWIRFPIVSLVVLPQEDTPSMLTQCFGPGNIC